MQFQRLLALDFDLLHLVKHSWRCQHVTHQMRPQYFSNWRNAGCHGRMANQTFAISVLFQIIKRKQNGSWGGGKQKNERRRNQAMIHMSDVRPHYVCRWYGPHTTCCRKRPWHVNKERKEGRSMGVLLILPHVRGTVRQNMVPSMTKFSFLCFPIFRK